MDEAYEILDTLPGVCPECGYPGVIIDGAGGDIPKYWAYCDPCTRCFCPDSSTPNEVASNFAKGNFYGS